MQHNLWLFLAKISTRCNEKTENLINIKGGDLELDFCLHLKTMAPVIAVKQGPSDPNIKSDAGAIIYLYVNISFCYLFYHSWPHFSFSLYFPSSCRCDILTRFFSPFPETLLLLLLVASFSAVSDSRIHDDHPTRLLTLQIDDFGVTSSVIEMAPFQQYFAPLTPGIKV